LAAFTPPPSYDNADDEERFAAPPDYADATGNHLPPDYDQARSLPPLIPRSAPPAYSRLSREALIAEAFDLSQAMYDAFVQEFSQALPRVHGWRARIALRPERRNELRYERGVTLDRRGALLDDYFSRLRDLAEQSRQAREQPGASAEFRDELDGLLDGIEQFYLPFRLEHNRQLRH
jgi:hypothetical protein